MLYFKMITVHRKIYFDESNKKIKAYRSCFWKHNQNANITQLNYKNGNIRHKEKSVCYPDTIFFFEKAFAID